MITPKIKKLLVDVYAGASTEEIDKRLTNILKEAQIMELILRKSAKSLRNCGFDDNTEFGKIYIEIQKILWNTY